MHSTTMSMDGWRTKLCQSSEMYVLPSLTAWSKEVAFNLSGFQPTRARLVRAASGDKSAMPTKCTPGVLGICARYMEPNLPAPIRPIRTGRLSAWRCKSLACKFMRQPAILPKMSPEHLRACHWPKANLPGSLSSNNHQANNRWA